MCCRIFTDVPHNLFSCQHAGSPNVTSLTFNSLTNTFTCTSTGGPATNVTWRKDGTALAVDGTYRQTQTVINATTATYQNVLTIAESVSSIYGVYRCTVGNARGTSSALEVRGECTNNDLVICNMKESSCFIAQYSIYHC